LSESDAARLCSFHVISGHISRVDQEEYFADRQVLTILRNPIDRCLSWYYYARKIEVGVGDVALARTHDVDSFFRLPVESIFRNGSNRAVRQLGDHVLNVNCDLRSALRLAQDCPSCCVWVGRQEHLPEDMKRAFDDLPDTRLPRLNATDSRMSVGEISRSLKERIGGNPNRVECHGLDGRIRGDRFVYVGV